MSWFGDALKTAGTLYGVYSAKTASDDAASNSRAATAASAASAKSSLDFQKKRVADWKAIYGDAEANLAQHFNSLTPEYYATQGLEAFEAEFAKGTVELNENFAQMGISGSGLDAELTSQREVAAAETRAGIRNDAEQQVTDQKAQFLQIGLGQNPTAGMSTALTNQANNAANTATVARSTANTASSSYNQALAEGIPSAVSTAKSAYGSF